MKSDNTNIQQKLDIYLNVLVENSGSDLHLKSKSRVRARIDGVLKMVGKESMSPSQMQDLAKEILTKKQFEKLEEERSVDFTYVLKDSKFRFRVNLFYQLDGLSAVFRTIPTTIPTLEEMNLPKSLESFTKVPRGLVLVTGVTGSGKSTTLAALLGIINETQKKHIITIEDPIEFVHQDKSCLINQRSVGQDTRSFSEALRSALREDPDIILVGEMRDLETIDIALHAANTGHLVFSTVHTLDAKETIDRIVGMFPTAEQNRIRVSLASVLEGTISQRLIPTKRGGRIAAIEILKKTARIEQLIRENRDYEIPDALFEGKDIYGTQTFDQALVDLLRSGYISEETALEYATSPSDMKLKIKGIGKGALLSDEEQSRSLDAFELKEEERKEEDDWL